MSWCNFTAGFRCSSRSNDRFSHIPGDLCWGEEEIAEAQTPGRETQRGSHQEVKLWTAERTEATQTRTTFVYGFIYIFVCTCITLDVISHYFIWTLQTLARVSWHDQLINVCFCNIMFKSLLTEILLCIMGTLTITHMLLFHNLWTDVLWNYPIKYHF